MTSTGQNRPENAFKEVDSSRVKTLLACILKKLYLGKGLFRSGPRRKVRSVNKAYLFATPGGEPLWRVSDDLAIFVRALHPTKKCCNGRLPGITQRDVFTLSFSIRLHTRGCARKTLGHSREPPVFTCFGGISDMTKCCEGRRDTRQSGSLQAS